MKQWEDVMCEQYRSDELAREGQGSRHVPLELSGQAEIKAAVSSHWPAPWIRGLLCTLMGLSLGTWERQKLNLTRLSEIIAIKRSVRIGRYWDTYANASLDRHEAVGGAAAAAEPSPRLMLNGG